MRIPGRKTSLYILLVAVAVLAAIVFIAPRLLDVKAIKGTVAAHLRHDLHGEVAIGAIQLLWLPTPHVHVRDLSIDNDILKAKLPGVDLYPSWISLLPGITTSVKSVVLTQPQVVVKKIAAGKAMPKLPSLTVEIIDGSITTPGVDTGKAIDIPALSFSSVNASIDMDADSLALRINGSSSFVEKLSFTGKVNLSTLRYMADVDCQGLIVHKGSIVQGDAGKDFAAVDSVLNVKGSINGQGAYSFSSNIIGDMPCLLYTDNGKETPINCGFGDISINKDGRALSFKINDLEVLEPSLVLTGVVSRTPKAGAPDQWLIDLVGKKLDLTAIRTGVLNFLPENKIAALVCDIVRGGQANSGSFFFKGPLADMAHLHNMTIAADVKSAEIHVPHVNLDLYEAAGPILIKDGALTGKGLTTKLGNSVGTNGLLLVGLAPHNFSLELDLDIHADLVDIDRTLRDLVPNKLFQKELARFGKPQGTAFGHLKLGDHQHHIDVKVDVAEMSGTLHYDRSPWPINVHAGKLKVDTKGVVSWQDVSGDLGPQHIIRTAGSVNWQEKPVALAIDVLEAKLDSGALYKGLELYPALLHRIEPVISKINGTVNLGKGSAIKGPYFNPSQWRYALFLSGHDIDWRSPLLPDDVSTRSVTAVLRDTGINLQESDNLIESRSLSVRADLQHHLFRNWAGSMDFSGVISTKTGDWINGKKWLPPTLQPLTPARVEKMHLHWGDGTLILAGKLLAGLNGSNPPTMDFDVQSHEDNPLVMKLDFTNDQEHGHLALDFLDRKPETFSLEWSGLLSKETVNSLMADKELLIGKLEGDFRMILPGLSTDSRFKGWLRADGFRWYWGDKTEMVKVETLRLHGNDNELLVKRFDVDFGNGESVISRGLVTPEVKGLKVDFDLSAPLFSMSTIKDFLADLDTLKAKQVEGCEGPVSEEWSMVGKIDFDVDNFKTRLGEDGPDAKSKSLNWHPVAGQIQLYPGKKTTVKVDTASLCCMGVTGEWNSLQTHKDSSFKIATECDPLPLLQDVLPCLGINQDMVEGSFRIDGDIQGMPGNWQSGKLIIHSDKGRILRMSMLSKIFTVVNLTDLFSEDTLPDMEKEGFAYSSLDFEVDVKDNRLVINKAVIRGKGLNLFARGEMNLKDFDTDFTVLIAPFKTLDAILSYIPFIGRVFGGKYATLVTIPVRVTGPFHDPDVIPLSPTAISESLLNIVKDVLTMPVTILSPLLPDAEKAGETPSPAPEVAPQ